CLCPQARVTIGRATILPEGSVISSALPCRATCRRSSDNRRYWAGDVSAASLDILANEGARSAPAIRGSRLPRDAILVPCLALLVCRIHTHFRSAPDSCGDRLLCRGTAGSGPLGHCLDGVRCPERLVLFGEFGNRWSDFLGLGRTMFDHGD